MKGLGGVGKSVLAQEYAWRNRARYHGVWWIRAEKAETLLDDLIELGARFIPGLKGVPDRAQAAHAALAAHRADGTARSRGCSSTTTSRSPASIAKLTPVDGAQVLITTRWSDWGRAASLVKVGVFPADVAAQFLLDDARADRPGGCGAAGRDAGIPAAGARSCGGLLPAHGPRLRSVSRACRRADPRGAERRRLRR